MTIIENKWILTTLVVLCWALSASFMTGYYYFQYSDLSSKVKRQIISVNLGINYGNGSAVHWFNETKTNAGSTLLDLTKLLASVNYTENVAGASVNAIDDVPNSYPRWWVWWSESSYGWTFGPVSCDKYVIGENETMLWYRQDISTYPPPSP
ncbi:hypothetical protein MUP01_04270 [Candidatus Bathyarchaeota archaeon]|nr:hypothetical protein [Candidatus Bathyarchaeota archaeon]